MKVKNLKDMVCELVLNFHLIELCNYGCIYCFAKYGTKGMLSLGDAKCVVDRIAKFYDDNRINAEFRRINLAGGEPTLYQNLDELISYIHGLGIKVSVITNGSRLTADTIASWAGKVYCIGISVDSVREGTLVSLGCRDGCGKCLTREELVSIAGAVRAAGIRLKINVVVSKLNLGEAREICELVREIRPDRLKLLKLQIVRGVNENSKWLAVSDDEYDGFCSAITCDGTEIVREKNGDIQNAYLMIDPRGRFYVNDRGRHKRFGNLLRRDLTSVMKRALRFIDTERYTTRYYNPGAGTDTSIHRDEPLAGGAGK